MLISAVQKAAQRERLFYFNQSYYLSTLIPQLGDVIREAVC